MTMNDDFKRYLHKFEFKNFTAYVPYDTLDRVWFDHMHVLFTARKRADVEEFFDDYGISPNYRMRDEEGASPFLLAVRRDDDDIVNLFLLKVFEADGAHGLAWLLETADINGQTPLGAALQLPGPEIAVTLLKSGAKPEDVPDPHGFLRKYLGEKAAKGMARGLTTPLEPLPKIILPSPKKLGK